MAHLSLPYGSGSLDLDLPDAWLGCVATPAASTPPVDSGEFIRHALAHPHTSPGLPDLARPGQRVALLVDDYTRSTPAHLLLKPLLADLLNLGIRQNDIRLVLAPGSHRLMTASELAHKLGELPEQFAVVQVSSHDQDRMLYLGQAAPDLPVWANRHVVEADLRIGVGMITPHMDLGFSGGAKIILPGACSEATINAFHVRAAFQPGNPLGNPETPLRLEQEAFIQRHLPLHFIVNAVINPQDQLVGCFTGHPVIAQRQGVRLAQEVYGTPLPHRYPVVIANAYPYQHDLWQSTKGLMCGDLVTSDGGTLILLAHATEGCGEYPHLTRYIGLSRQELVESLASAKTVDPKAAATGLMVQRLKERLQLVLVSQGLTRSQACEMGFAYFDRLEDAIASAVRRLSPAQQARSVCLLTHAGYQLPRLGER